VSLLFSSPARGVASGGVVKVNGNGESSHTLRGPIRDETVGMERPMSRRGEFYGGCSRNDSAGHQIQDSVLDGVWEERVCREGEVKGR
jgi:hypothetical protein